MWLSRTEQPPEREKEKKSVQFPLLQKICKLGTFFGIETEACMTQRTSSFSDSNRWLLLNTIGVHWCRHYVQGMLLEDSFSSVFNLA